MRRHPGIVSKKMPESLKHALANSELEGEDENANRLRSTLFYRCKNSPASERKDRPFKWPTAMCAHE